MEQVDVVYNKCGICNKPENDHCCFVCDLKGMTHKEFIDHTYTKEHDKKTELMMHKKKYCEKCDIQFETLKGLEKHKETKMHMNGRMSKDELYCHKCKTQCANKQKWEDHILTQKHIMEPFTKKHCEKCNVTLNCKSAWEEHCKTKKHNKSIEVNGETIS